MELSSLHYSTTPLFMISIWELANPQLRDITVYQPGKPIEETARELGLHPDAIIKLASNENPLGPSPKAMEAMREALETGHLYPDGGGFCLCNAVAAEALTSVLIAINRKYKVPGAGIRITGIN